MFIDECFGMLNWFECLRLNSMLPLRPENCDCEGSLALKGDASRYEDVYISNLETYYSDCILTY